MQLQLLRRAAASLGRRIQVPSQLANPSLSVKPLLVSSTSQSGRSNGSNKFGVGGSTWGRNDNGSLLWIIAAGQAAIFIAIDGNTVLADASVESDPKTELQETGEIGLQKIDDGSVVSNIHTSKWRVFTDSGRDFFLQAGIFLGKLDNAEKLFISALNEAKEGFGEKDPHVASACNNLAELYRVKKEFNKAEPLYLKAINVLEETFGPEDIRVGAALHNMGQFYLVQRKLEEACKCYERSLKIKGRVLGFNNPDYADTMYHLGTVCITFYS
ncbi:nphp3 [Linum grandiflorum]